MSTFPETLRGTLCICYEKMILSFRIQLGVSFDNILNDMGIPRCLHDGHQERFVETREVSHSSFPFFQNS